jgi:isovaleryl-CoA dehydrogenase
MIPIPKYMMKEDTKEVQKTARKAAEKIKPFSTKIDKENMIPEEVVRILTERGLFGVTAPRIHGGQGLGIFELTIAMMEIGRICTSVARSLMTHHIAIEAIKNFGNEEQKREYLPRLAGGEFGTIATTEPSGGSDVVGATRTVALKTDSGFSIKGTKTLITNGMYCGIFIILAKLDDKLTAFIVEKEDGVNARSLEPFGDRGSGLASLRFDCKIPDTRILGEAGRGLKVALHSLNSARITQAGIAIGLAFEMLQKAIDYSKKREVFNKTVSDFQGIQWALADLHTKLEAAKLLTLNAAQEYDNGTYTPAIPAMAKLFAADVAIAVSRMAVQVYGGHGILQNSSVGRGYRDAKFFEIGGGTSEIMRLIISRELFQR